MSNIPYDDAAPYGLKAIDYRDEIVQAWYSKDFKQFHKLTKDSHASDLALIVGDIRSDERVNLLKKLKPKTIIPEILVELEDGLRADILAQLPLSTIASYMEFLESDDRLALIEDFPDAWQQKLLAILAPKIRNDLIRGLEFAPDAAGRIMRREFVSIAQDWQVGQVIDYLRNHQSKLPEFHNIMVLNKRFEPVGVLIASKLLSTKRNVLVHDIMAHDPKLIAADMPQEDVAQFFRKYGLVENPVINHDGVLLGTITLDDVIHLVDEQAEDDMLNLAGVAEHDFHGDVLDVARTRGSWLLVNLFTAILASAAIALFDEALEEIVALAILMPIIASMGGNAGTQSLAVTVRALALEYLTPATGWRILLREIYVGLLNGILFAALAAFVVWLWFARLDLSMVIAFAMIVNLVIATLAGTLIPLLLHYYNLDPAIGSAVILTTITDIIGFCVFLGMASWLLL